MITSLKLVLLLALLAIPAAVQAQFICTTNNGGLTITGYEGPAGAASIPASLNGLPVTSIGSKAFGSCTNLTDVTIPASVTSIGSAAFYDCTSLTNVTIPTSVISIGDHAFAFCARLNHLTIPSCVTNRVW
jgi:hypothetical protein